MQTATKTIRSNTLLDPTKIERGFLWMLFLFLVYLVTLTKVMNIHNGEESLLFTIYSFTISTYIISRFLISHFYLTDKYVDESYQPSITFAVPAKNEETVILKTIASIARQNYPKEKLEIICVNDGSTDKTLRQMYLAKEIANQLGVRAKVKNWHKNRGKREGMAYCAREATGEIIVFIDSDSIVDKEAARELVKLMANRKIGAVTGHTYVANEKANTLAKMQAVRYFIAFRAYKSAEAIFGSVTCCSGPCTAYRREYLMEVLQPWLEQKFLNVQCTYGDDRSLTNFILEKGYRTLYTPEAKVYTYVPEEMKQYLKQQLRWKKSWTRECMRAAKFMWRTNIFMSLSFYISLLLPFVTPIIIIRAFVIYPLTHAQLPLYYFYGVALMTFIVGIYYTIYSGDRRWLSALLLSTFYSIVFFWQLPYAILTIKDTSWGTR